MKAEFINPFLSSAALVFKQVAGLEVKRGSLGLKSRIEPSYEVVIAFGVVGDVKGDVAYSMRKETALKIASTMAMGMPFESLDNEIARSAIGELGNMITGGAMTELAARGIQADISPPTIVVGEGLKVYSVVPAIVIPLSTDLGEIELSVALQET